MATNRKTTKRHKINNPEANIHTDSIDLSSDYNFLVGHSSCNYVPLSLLISGRITNSSFSNLYEKSTKIGWSEVFIEERRSLKLDEKSKPKRFMFNRLIQICDEDGNDFNQQVQMLNDEMKSQMSNYIIPESEAYARLQTENGLYAEVKAWRELQCERRLFHKKCNHLCSLLTLQRRITNRCIDLIDLIYHDPNFLQSTALNHLIELLNHSLIIVVQPSGTDSFGITKYEKIGDDFVVKLKTRIICLLDPDIVKEYVGLSSIDVILFLKDRNRDPTGDKQLSLEWKTQTVICDAEFRTFYYADITENDPIKLTKKTAKKRPSYNNELCQLEFQTTLVIGNIIKIRVSLNSQLFGICSHVKYCPKNLAKVFIEEVNKLYTDINLKMHINVFTGYICQFYKRVTGVEAKCHTQQFIRNQLDEVFQVFQEYALCPKGPVMLFSLNIYENIVEKLFTQIRFLTIHPFLSMMYHESLFRGMCDDTIDEKITRNTQEISQMLMRFEVHKKQEPTENPNIIVVIRDDNISKARITHAYLIDDMCRCFYEASKNEANQLQIVDDNKSLPFSNFAKYYDNDLSRDNLIQADDDSVYFPLNVLLRNTIRTIKKKSQILHEQQNITHTFNLSGEFTGGMDLTADAIGFLQEQFNRWCELQNVRGSLENNSINNKEIADNEFPFCGF